MSYKANNITKNQDKTGMLVLKVSKFLEQKKLTISVVESCTGGFIQKLLTDIPGSSKYFLGGVIAYSDRLKENIIGVKQEVLEKYGAVSEESALQLADGIRRLTGSNIGISVTGIAGPTGGTRGKPVGLVYIGICIKIGYYFNLTATRFLFKGTRFKIREEAVNKAFKLIASTFKAACMNYGSTPRVKTNSVTIKP